MPTLEDFQNMLGQVEQEKVQQSTLYRKAVEAQAAEEQRQQEQEQKMGQFFRNVFDDAAKIQRIRQYEAGFRNLAARQQQQQVDNMGIMPLVRAYGGYVRRFDDGGRVTQEDLDRNGWRWAGIDELQDLDPLYKTIDPTDSEWLVDSSGRLVHKSTVEHWLNSYERQTPWQAQNNNAADEWLRKRMADRFVSTLGIKDWIKPKSNNLFSNLQLAKVDPEMSGLMMYALEHDLGLLKDRDASILEYFITAGRDLSLNKKELKDRYEQYYSAFDELGPQFYMHGTPQRTFLLNRELQEQEFLNDGWIRMPSNKENYGLVNNAVGSRSLPVWQTSPDAMPRDSLKVIGNIDNIWFGDPKAGLPFALNNPSAIYVDKHGQFYQKAWDLNDYGGAGGSTAGIGGKLLDLQGSPTVVTTGYQPISTDVYWDKVEPKMRKVSNYDSIMHINPIQASFWPNDAIIGPPLPYSRIDVRNK